MFISNLLVKKSMEIKSIVEFDLFYFAYNCGKTLDLNDFQTLSCRNSKGLITYVNLLVKLGFEIRRENNKVELLNKDINSTERNFTSLSLSRLFQFKTIVEKKLYVFLNSIKFFVEFKTTKDKIESSINENFSLDKLKGITNCDTLVSDNHITFKNFIVDIDETVQFSVATVQPKVEKVEKVVQKVETATRYNSMLLNKSEKVEKVSQKVESNVESNDTESETPVLTSEISAGVIEYLNKDISFSLRQEDYPILIVQDNANVVVKSCVEFFTIWLRDNHFDQKIKNILSAKYNLIFNKVILETL